MATLSPGKLLTAEEFMELPDPIDGSKQELVKGVIVTMPPPMAPPPAPPEAPTPAVWSGCATATSRATFAWTTRPSPMWIWRSHRVILQIKNYRLKGRFWFQWHHRTPIPI